MFAKLKLQRKPIHDPRTLSWILIKIAIRDTKYSIFALKCIKVHPF